MAPVVSQAIVPAEDHEDAAPARWTSEPQTLKELLDAHIIETKFAARHPGTSLYLAVASTREGAEVNILPGQKFKLFLVPWTNPMIEKTFSIIIV